MFKIKRFLSVFIFSTLFLGLTATVYLSLRSSGAFDIRRKAAELPPTGSTLSFLGPNQVKTGDKFSVNIILDTTSDPNHIISEADTAVGYQTLSLSSPKSSLTPVLLDDILPTQAVEASGPAIMLISVSPGKIFDNYPLFPASSTYGRNMISVWGKKNYSVDANWYFRGYSGRGVFATLDFVALQPGKAEITINKSQISGYPKNKPVNGEKDQQNLIGSTKSFAVTIL